MGRTWRAEATANRGWTRWRCETTPERTWGPEAAQVVQSPGQPRHAGRSCTALLPSAASHPSHHVRLPTPSRSKHAPRSLTAPAPLSPSSRGQTRGPKTRRLVCVEETSTERWDVCILPPPPSPDTQHPTLNYTWFMTCLGELYNPLHWKILLGTPWIGLNAITPTYLRKEQISLLLKSTADMMYTDPKNTYGSDDDSALCLFPGIDPTSSSLSSASSMLSTPKSFIRGTSFDSVKIEGDSFQMNTPSGTPERYGSTSGFCAMTSLTQDMLSGFQQSNMGFSIDHGQPMPDQSSMVFNNMPMYGGPAYDAFITHHGLQIEPPALDMDPYSPTPGLEPSPLPIDYVVPSQTTFLNSFDMLSPMKPMRPLVYNSPESDCATDGSTVNSVGFLDQYYPRPTTFEPMIAEVQQRPAEANTKHTRRRTKRQVMVPQNIQQNIPQNIPVQRRALKSCTWEGCTSKFQRAEHLKRHEKTHSGSESYECPFCQKIFGRSDNLKSHIKIHMKLPTKSTRTRYFSDAARVVESMTRKPRKNGTNLKSKTETGPNGTKTQKRLGEC
ncbi:hypothetical protein B7494_g7565 [Chlorociboria aeruginascens]|nr:hypothetical protein B7494_g7565 [Chlorociboria aeruginascens]